MATQTIRLTVGTHTRLVREVECKYRGTNVEPFRNSEWYDVTLPGVSALFTGAWDGDARHHVEVHVGRDQYRGLSAADRSALSRLVKRRRAAR